MAVFPKFAHRLAESVWTNAHRMAEFAGDIAHWQAVFTEKGAHRMADSKSLRIYAYDLKGFVQ